jgi:hypothetical protein
MYGRKYHGLTVGSTLSRSNPFPVGPRCAVGRQWSPGLPLGAEPMAYVLWTRFLQYNPANPEVLAGLRREIDRDDAVTVFEANAKELKHGSR